MGNVSLGDLHSISGERTLPPPLREECERLVARASSSKKAYRVIPRLKRIAALYPQALDAQTAYATAMNLTGDREKVLEVWTAIHGRFPKSAKALQQRIAWLAKSQRSEEARRLIDDFCPSYSRDVNVLLERADLLFILNEFEETKTTFELILRVFPDHADARLRYAKRLKQLGMAVQAVKLLEPALTSGHATKSTRSLYDELTKALQTMRRLAPERLARGDDTNLIALHCVLLKFATRVPRALPPDRLGPTALITGSLGPGGAERQLASTAELLAESRETGKPIAGTAIEGPLHVLVKSLAKEDDRDFFLHKIADAEIGVWEIDDMPPVSSTDFEEQDPEVRNLLSFMSAPTQYGLRLVDWFRRERIDVAYIWQDGAVLFAAIAALLAGVPRIVLNMRGLPPNIRVHKHRPEYEDLYRDLLTVPGVTFVSNSATAAKAYSEWLGCAPDRFRIIHNGIDVFGSEPERREVARWQVFERKTTGATHTIGSVFRMDVDKRPLHWIEFAHRYLTSHPTARFVIVGKGAMLESARQRAAELNIKNRILFVGQSRAVGYWLKKFDVFVLLSRFEGIPNVLIEAQLSGIGVVSTPAGSACDTFIEGVTGVSTRDIAPLDLDDVCCKVDQILSWSRGNAFFSKKAIRNAKNRFSKHAMMERTVRVLMEAESVMPGADEANSERKLGGTKLENYVAF